MITLSFIHGIAQNCRDSRHNIDLHSHVGNLRDRERERERLSIVLITKLTVSVTSKVISDSRETEATLD
jgi:hypothetical protein